ncbi:MAG: DUF4382 domain-containing protein [Armatimonadetes bacterium]|nr:DUF4382 domain-containing protein [Armatimonadota bacterium]
MKNRIWRIAFVFLSLLILTVSLVSCGGSSDGTGSGSAFNLFATDDLNADYTGVWVKVYHADMVDSTGAKVDLLTSTDGVTVNLRALNDGAAKFLLLCPGKLPAGTYTKVEFELDKSVTLVATGSGTVSTADFPDSYDATVAGHSLLSADITPNLTVPGSSKLIIDFDLKNWTVSSGVITPVLTVSSGTGFDDGSRHEPFEFRGTVGDLAGTAPTQTFTLNLKNGGTISVTTSDTTAIVGDGGVTSLSNGMNVHVYGTFDPTTNTITATSIRADSEFSSFAAAVGAASNGDALAQTFTLTPKCVHGFVPQGDSLTVSTSDTTKYRGHHGSMLTEAQFYEALAAAGDNAVVDAEGTYDSGSNTLTAKSVHIENETEVDHAEAQGTVTAADLTTGTFTLTVSESDGFANNSDTLSVVVSVDALFTNNEGHIMTEADFFAALASPTQRIKIKGSFANGVFTATRLQLKH